MTHFNTCQICMATFADRDLQDFAPLKQHAFLIPNHLSADAPNQLCFGGYHPPLEVNREFLRKYVNNLTTVIDRLPSPELAAVAKFVFLTDRLRG